MCFVSCSAWMNSQMVGWSGRYLNPFFKQRIPPKFWESVKSPNLSTMPILGFENIRKYLFFFQVQYTQTQKYWVFSHTSSEEMLYSMGGPSFWLWKCLSGSKPNAFWILTAVLTITSTSLKNKYFINSKKVQVFFKYEPFCLHYLSTFKMKVQFS